MQTSGDTAPSLSGQQAMVAMATREQTGASRGAGNSPSPGGITVNQNLILMNLVNCSNVQLGNNNTMNIFTGSSSHPHNPRQGDDDGSSSDSFSDDEDDNEDDRRRKMEQNELLKVLKKTSGSEEDKPATRDQLQKLSQKLGKQWMLFCKIVGLTDQEIEYELALQGRDRPAAVAYNLLLLQQEKSGKPFTVSQLARAIRKLRSDCWHLVELLQ